MYGKVHTNIIVRQKRVLLISILASFVSIMESFITNVALPAIERELGGGLSAQQWIVNAYLLMLGSLILLAGSLSDIYGRQRILKIGLAGFGLTSILCAIAPGTVFLIISRAAQGAAGAMLVPSSLALIMASFSGKAESEAIGKWTAWTVIAAIIGPFLGGVLVDFSSWRLIFGINVIPVAITLWLMRSLDAEQQTDEKAIVDMPGAILAALGLGTIMYALIEQPRYGWNNPVIYLSLTAGLFILTAFLIYESHAQQPMLPLKLFVIRNFGIGNLATLFNYGGIYLAMFLIVIFIQQIAGYSAVAAGLTLLPAMILLFLFSSQFGRLAGRYGPHFFMSVGPVLAGLGFLPMLTMDQSANYWSDLLPGLLIFGLGLSITVAPLTAAVLGAVEKQRSGIASAVNNSVSRLAGLVTIAAVGIVTGPELTITGFRAGLWFTAFLLFSGGIVSAIGIRNNLSDT